MSKLVLALALTLLVGCGFLKQPVGPTVPVSERTVKVIRSCPKDSPVGGGQGSGVDVGGGYVVTAAHVANPAFEGCSYVVVDKTGTQMPGVAMTASDVADAATLRIERETEPLCFRQASIGEPVVAIGYPKGKFTVTHGEMLTDPNDEFEQVTNAPIDQGNSGGGVWTTEGCLAGLTIAKFTAFIDTPLSIVVSSRALPPLLP